MGGGGGRAWFSRAIVFAIRIRLGWGLDRSHLKYPCRAWATPADAERKSKRDHGSGAIVRKPNAQPMEIREKRESCLGNVFMSTLRSCGQKTFLARGVAKSSSLRTELWSNANRNGTRARAHGRRRPESAQRQMLTSNRKLSTTSTTSTSNSIGTTRTNLAVLSPRSGAK